MIIGTPSAIKGSVNMISEEVKKELEKKRKEKEEEELMKKLEAERIQQKVDRKEGLRRRKEQQKSKILERTDEELAAYSATIIKHRGNEDIKTKLPITGGLWTDEDLIELTRLTKKYPGGTVDRWEIIAEAMGRNVSEVTFMAYKLKDNVYQKPGETEKLVENINKEISKKIKTKSAATELSANPEKGWSQEQQKALEAAIQKYPKGGNEDRWLKIANSVPGKSKEECQLRYKYLVEKVKKQKEEKEKQERAEEEETQAVEEEVVKESIEEQEQIETEQVSAGGGKKRNARRDRKKNVDYYAEDSDESDWSQR